MGYPVFKYVIKKDDNLSTIVEKAGFPKKDWKVIYSSKHNADFRKQFPNPNKILKGAVFYLPIYRPDSYKRLLHFMNQEEKAVKYYGDLIKAMEKSVKSKIKLKKEAESWISGLKKDAKNLEDIASDANDTCSGDWAECMGAGMYATKTYREAKVIRQEVARVEKLVKARKYDDAIASVKKKIVVLKKEQSRAVSIVKGYKKGAQEALKNPYK